MAPFTVITAFAFTSMPAVASMLTPICDFISMPLACMVNLPVDGFDRDIRIGFDGNGVLGAIDNDLVLAGLVDHLDGLVAGFVVEPHNVAAARLESAVIVLAVRVGFRGIVLAIPERTQDVRMIDLAMLEGDQHLIVDLGKKVRAPALSRHGAPRLAPNDFPRHC